MAICPQNSVMPEIGGPGVFMLASGERPWYYPWGIREPSKRAIHQMGSLRRLSPPIQRTNNMICAETNRPFENP